ncbi:zinc finger BED domain-containing protein RICESLEEPER 1-like [Prosopis cineraria]|uniref:zinc finger BED domain-containing protein RICESLEEPER 1-like n=1 Tax=Prosopis cineraria TaxID=364024 RepID=UPI00240EC4D5|nr:zinc finger BED domain-containing protein RICESLEEPER 1-like [Prosopis cineraria]
MGLRLDVPTKWNSTYAMLESGVKYRGAFLQLPLRDLNYKHGLTNEEWHRAEAMCTFLRPFEKITRLISSSSYPTSNMYFMQISKIQMLLDANKVNADLVIQEMATRMKEKFDKYWTDYNVILVLGVIFDPRWKFNMIQYFYSKIDPITCHKKVADIKSKLNFIFYEYSNVGTLSTGVGGESSSKTSTVTINRASHTASVSTSSATTFDDTFDDYQDIYTSIDDFSLDKSELENYLDEPILKPHN